MQGCFTYGRFRGKALHDTGVKNVIARPHPVNLNASREVRNLLNRLYDTAGKGIISGQHNYYEQPEEWTVMAGQKSGKIPGLWGSDFAYKTYGDLHVMRQHLVNIAVKRWNSGQIVCFTYHQIKPSDEEGAGWSSVQGDYSESEMEELVTPGTELYNRWLERTDEIAGYLKQLRDVNVPVLWRPYHEMNAGFFWWGGRPEPFKKLWINLYQRFTEYHDLTNLLWVWNPNKPDQWAYDFEDYYPGHEYVDALAIDIYGGDFAQAYYDRLLAVAEGRPVGIGECGNLPDIDIIAQDQPQYVWFMTWADYLTSYNTISMIRNVYKHPYTINAGETEISEGSVDTVR